MSEEGGCRRGAGKTEYFRILEKQNQEETLRVEAGLGQDQEPTSQQHTPWSQEFPLDLRIRKNDDTKSNVGPPDLNSDLDVEKINRVVGGGDGDTQTTLLAPSRIDSIQEARIYSRPSTSGEPQDLMGDKFLNIKQEPHHTTEPNIENIKYPIEDSSNNTTTIYSNRLSFPLGGNDSLLNIKDESISKSNSSPTSMAPLLSNELDRKERSKHSTTFDEEESAKKKKRKKSEISNNVKVNIIPKEVGSSLQKSSRNYQKVRGNNGLQLVCEWSDCSQCFWMEREFFSHVSGHCRDIPVRYTSVPNMTAPTPPIFSFSVSENSEHNISIKLTPGVESSPVGAPRVLLTCLWSRCSFETGVSGDMVRHVSIHGFHTKAKAYGAATIDSLGLYCKGGTYRNHVPSVDFFLWKCCWPGCKEANQEFTAPQDFFWHVNQHAEAQKDEIKTVCRWNDCGKTDRSWCKLVEHIRIQHTQELTVACPHCGFFFATNKKFLDHFREQESSREVESPC